MYEWLAQNSFCRRLLGENITICQENGNIPSILERIPAQPSSVFILWQCFHTSYIGTSACANNIMAMVVKDT